MKKHKPKKIIKSMIKLDKKLKVKKQTKFVFLFILVVLFGVSCFFNTQITLFSQHFFENNFNLITLDNKLSVHFVDVGEGDGIVIRFPNDEIAIIDCAPATSSTNFFNYIKEKVLSTLDSKTINYLILTHSDADHIGGAAKILQEFEVKNIYRPKIYAPSESEYTGLTITTNIYQSTIDAIYQEVASGANMLFSQHGIILNIGGVIMNFYAPTREYSTTNPFSPIIKLSYNGFSFLFTGDATIESEEDCMELYASELDVDVLKVGHHGASTSTSLQFLEQTTPEYAVISVGQNSYGHPSQTVLNNLNNADVESSQVYRTDIDGNILFAISSHISISTGDYKCIINIQWWHFSLACIVLCVVYCVVILTNFKTKRKK